MLDGLRRVRVAREHSCLLFACMKGLDGGAYNRREKQQKFCISVIMKGLLDEKC